MQTIEFRSLPVIRFAHIYSSERYHRAFPPQENFLEISYVSEGSLSVERDGEINVVKKGDVMCHFYQSAGFNVAEEFHRHHTVGAQVDWTPAAKTTGGLFLPFLTPAALVPQKVYEIIDDFIHRVSFYTESGSHAAAKFLELVCILDKCNRKSNGLDLPGELRYTQRAKEFIHQNLHSPISQGAVAEHLSITPEYLCSVFKKTEGVPLMKYINSLKLQAIRSIMEQENIRLYEAAALYGYTDPNYVSRLFKQYYGYPITSKPKIQT